MSAFVTLGVLTCLSGALAVGEPAELPTSEQVSQALERGTDFLLKSQNPNGS